MLGGGRGWAAARAARVVMGPIELEGAHPAKQRLEHPEWPARGPACAAWCAAWCAALCSLGPLLQASLPLHRLGSGFRLGLGLGPGVGLGLWGSGSPPQVGELPRVHGRAEQEERRHRGGRLVGVGSGLGLGSGSGSGSGSGGWLG